ncbi:PREDICTED: protein prenyltransferase alpha subunit repeat-containing protein 1-A [Ceratosolen solmsi marchali]|uniref:Protein prenyltransferase alpha subunit repeat-containing protein 1-A n=1 Tax=Ceratosolen solmsi marchali TaxID=326594 RepID=A0AAJ6YQK3_9HYME|nr:PREDICTED: protein prenyltransferase alpha subunit repeat-containing protein 1-A [Ceratosolen solmsi marchali]
MQEDVFPAAEKILSDVENIFKKDIDLTSFEIIPVEDNQNKSPVLHDNNSLGLASWCIRPLFCYVYNRLFDLRLNQCRREHSTVISKWLLGALLLNPDILTFWNMRRQFIRNGKLDPMEELRFVNIVLYYKAKCFEAFSYRRWILKLLLFKNQDAIHKIELLFRNEIQISSMAANRYSNNCHAWNHRKYIISMFETVCISVFGSLLDKEWEESTSWCNSHVSDYSGYDYRQFLLKRLLLRKRRYDQTKICSNVLEKRRDIIIKFVQNALHDYNNVFLHTNSYENILNLLHGVNFTKYSEVTFEQTLINLSYWVEDCIINTKLLQTFSGHETLWYHRRFLVSSLLALNNSYTNFFLYKIENLNSTVATTNISKSLLEIALKMQNKDLIDVAKRISFIKPYCAR